MKPTAQTNHMHKRGDTLARASARRLPKTDYSYQGAGLAEFSSSRNGRGTTKSSFRAISDNYFKGEARNDYAIEAAVFGLIVVTAAVPIFNGIVALLGFLRATAAL